jgi:hypothetical protein
VRTNSKRIGIASLCSTKHARDAWVRVSRFWFVLLWIEIQLSAPRPRPY